MDHSRIVCEWPRGIDAKTTRPLLWFRLSPSVVSESTQVSTRGWNRRSGAYGPGHWTTRSEGRSRLQALSRTLTTPLRPSGVDGWRRRPVGASRRRNPSTGDRSSCRETSATEKTLVPRRDSEFRKVTAETQWTLPSAVCVSADPVPRPRNTLPKMRWLRGRTVDPLLF